MPALYEPSGESVLRCMVAEWPSNQFFNLAFEEAFYRVLPRLGWGACLRFWRNDRVVVIGRFQCAVLEVNALEARRLGVKLVRRFTGGGAVYHDGGNLNYALALLRSVSPVKDMKEAFRFLGEAVADALGSLGVKDATYRPLNDIEVRGMKVSGLAASAGRKALFVHGAMLVSSDFGALWRVLKIPKEKLVDKKFVQSRRKRVTTLEEELGRSVGMEEVMKAIVDVVSEKLGLKPKWIPPTQPETSEARRLYNEKYCRVEWNLKYLDHVRSHLSPEELEALLEIARPPETTRQEVVGPE